LIPCPHEGLILLTLAVLFLLYRIIGTGTED
jgi:hypothetical protein